MQIGFVGLGKMGLNMVTRLARGGHDVVTFDRDPAARGLVGAATLAQGVGADRVAGTRIVGNRGAGRDHAAECRRPSIDRG